LQRKAGRLKPSRQTGQVIHAKFDLSLDGHRQQ
jgi:hypothetical protein